MGEGEFFTAYSKNNRGLSKSVKEAPKNFLQKFLFHFTDFVLPKMFFNEGAKKCVLDEFNMKEYINLPGRPSQTAPTHRIELFVQAEGVREPQLIELNEDAKVQDIIEAMQKHGLPNVPEIHVLREDEEEELPREACLKDLKIGNRHRLHCGRCHRAGVTVIYNGVAEADKFPVSATLKRIKKWADKQFGRHGYETDELQLQLAHDRNRHLDGTTHLGSVLPPSLCEVTFELRPKGFVQG